MHRIDHPTHDEDLHGAGLDGFTEGDPVASEPATVVTADILNAFQEELANAIERAGLTLSKGDNTQLRQAIEAYNFETPPSRTKAIPAGALEIWEPLEDPLGSPVYNPQVVGRRNAELPAAGDAPTSDFGSVGIRNISASFWGRLNLNDYLPHGAVLQNVRAAVAFQTTGPTSQIVMRLHNYGVNYDTWVASGTTTTDFEVVLNSVVVADGSGRKMMDAGGSLAFAIDHLNPSAHGYQLSFFVQGNNNHIHSIELTFDDPGPRNY